MRNDIGTDPHGGEFGSSGWIFLIAVILIITLLIPGATTNREQSGCDFEASRLREVQLVVHDGNFLRSNAIVQEVTLRDFISIAKQNNVTVVYYDGDWWAFQFILTKTSTPPLIISNQCSPL